MLALNTAAPNFKIQLDFCKFQVPSGVIVPKPCVVEAVPVLAMPVAANVLIVAQPALIKGSAIPLSLGDLDAPLGGLISGTVGQKVEVKTGSAKVRAAGAPMAMVGALLAGNNQNTFGPALQSGQVVVDLLA